MKWWLPAGLVLTGACGPSAPSAEDIDQARAQLEGALEMAAPLRPAFTLLGLLPSYECGEPRRSFVGRAADQLRTQVGCVKVSPQAVSGEADLLELEYPDSGCGVQDYSLRGRTRLRYSGGDDRFEAEADFRETLLSDKPLPARAGYGSCGDSRRYFLSAQGPLPKLTDATFRVDGQVTTREGLPLLGSTTLVLDGPGEVSHGAGTDRVTFTGLQYELKQLAPKEGRVLIETSSGRRIDARFSTHLWRLGEAEVTVDDSAPVRIPIIR